MTDEAKVSQRGRLPINPQPLKIVPAAQREAWRPYAPIIQLCEFCGSNRARVEPVEVERQTPTGTKYRAKGWRCTNRKSCRERVRRLEGQP